MPDTVNPYIPGQPVDNPELFFGRRDTLASIREHLLKGRRVFVVSGAPRMGRSSLLRQLPHYIPEECVLARVELLEENAQRLDWLLWRLADAVGHQAGHLLGVGGREPTWDSFEGNPGALLDEFWPQMRAALGKRCLLLMLDDLDSLAETDAELLDSFLRILEVLRDRDSELALVLASSPELQDVLLREYPRLFGGALSYSIGPLNSEDASRLITWPVDGVLTYDYGVARRVIEVTSGHPYYLQMICFELFNRCAASAWVNQRDVDLVVEDLVGREIPDFRRLWHESSPQEQAVLAGLVSLRGARGVATVQEVRTVLNKAGARADRDQVTHALESLASRGIMERLGALSYRFRVGLLRDWLAERLDLQDVV
ncbi:MAG TPA: AAA family ATPase, partial [Anaerolineae bacterium]|nr:AAA family ATPase [Anaerolineae bacterium]